MGNVSHAMDLKIINLTHSIPKNNDECFRSKINTSTARVMFRSADSIMIAIELVSHALMTTIALIFRLENVKKSLKK